VAELGHGVPCATVSLESAAELAFGACYLSMVGITETLHHPYSSCDCNTLIVTSQLLRQVGVLRKRASGEWFTLVIYLICFVCGLFGEFNCCYGWCLGGQCLGEDCRWLVGREWVT
jgi:hypothetical protein